MRYRGTRKITHRVSSVTNGFVQAILPDAVPDADEHSSYLDILGIDPDNKTCAYCGDPANHWDHLFPYVKEKRPSGFLNEARNLVPACGPCNTSKSGQDWRAWMFGNAKGSPRTRGIEKIDELAARLDRFVAKTGLEPLDIGLLVPAELWDSYWTKRDLIEAHLIEAQEEAGAIKRIVEQALAAGRP